MPIYEFECRGCGTRFEVLCSINSGSDGVTCPECESGDIKRLISTFYSKSSSSSGSCSCGSSCGSSSCNCGGSCGGCGGCH
ncbi:MAG: FmdB family zinc ribbon protein [Armatimonadota bacterium]